MDFENLKKEELKAISHKSNSMEFKKGQYALAHDLYRELFTKYIIDKLGFIYKWFDSRKK